MHVNVHTVEARVAGIPCIIRVDHLRIVTGSYNYNAPSDWDYYGYEEVEYTICDRRGRPAPWLERKATDRDHDEIKTLILEAARD
jgi:hypothetical protein